MAFCLARPSERTQESALVSASFPAAWAHFRAAHTDREAARHFAKVLGQIEAQGLTAVAATVTTALTTGASLALALAAAVPAGASRCRPSCATWRSRVAVPPITTGGSRR